MRKTLFIMLSFAVLTLAQGNVGRSPHGFRVPSAHTIGQGFFYLSGSYESVSDGEPLVMDGFSTESLPNKIAMEENIPSASGHFQLSYGFFDFLQLDLGLPIHYDGDMEGLSLGGAGIGDMQIALKADIPMDFPLHIGFNAELYAPTGPKSTGLRPRHAWYMQSDKNSYAFTYGQWAFSGSLLLTLDIFEIIMWNSTFGYLATFDGNNDALLWGTGLEFFPKSLFTLIVEISGETRTSELGHAPALWNEILRMTPGIRLHLPHQIDLMFGIDIGIDLFRDRKNDEGYRIQRNDHGETLSYTVPGTSKIGFSFALTKTFDFSWKDSDRDGVPDRLDMCPKSTWGVIVNSRGCPVDEDQDGVLNAFDDCPGTPYGVSVDFFGCPIDTDQDSVPDYLDKCPNTPQGFAVDEFGCIRDSDKDGVDDNNDKCPNTMEGDPVDEFGCPLDEDHDGVPNDKDMCLGTPTGRTIDEFGCPLDGDRDGIPDDLDQCPDTEEGEIVNDEGCPLDSDGDGISDSKDRCPGTEKGYPVDSYGCPTDKDNDGVPDAIDKCPGTPAKASVDSDGCPLDSDGDGIPDIHDLCKNTLKGIPVNSQGCPIDEKLNLDNIAQRIKFKEGSDTLLNGSFTAINDAILLMRKFNVKLKISITASGNISQELTQKRAVALARHFENKGFGEKWVSFENIQGNKPSIKIEPQENPRP